MTKLAKADGQRITIARYPDADQVTVAGVCTSAHPNAGLPNPLAETGYDESPDYTASLIKEFALSGFVNIVGGCCGTTPAHIKAIAEVVRGRRGK